MLFRAAHLGQYATVSPILAMPLAVALYVPAPMGPAGNDAMEVTSGPAIVLARMVSDIDSSGAGQAETEHNETITVYAPRPTGQELCGREVLVYHSPLWNQWRLITTDIGTLSPHLRPSCDVAVAHCGP